jgi:hypothetical protein
MTARLAAASILPSTLPEGIGVAGHRYPGIQIYTSLSVSAFSKTNTITYSRTLKSDLFRSQYKEGNKRGLRRAQCLRCQKLLGLLVFLIRMIIIVQPSRGGRNAIRISHVIVQCLREKRVLKQLQTYGQQQVQPANEENAVFHWRAAHT